MQHPAGFRGAFRTDTAARALYAEGAGLFRIIPAAVAVPTGTDDLVRLVRWARETGTPLVPRGAGSGMPGGNVGPGVVVDLTQGFREAPAIDPDRRTARCGAAVTWRDVNGAAAGHGLRLPPDPSSGAFCTLGGMVACNAAGARSLKYGAIRAWVDAVEFVTADGEVGRAGKEDLPPDVLTAAERRVHLQVRPYLVQNRLTLEQRQPRTRKNSSGYLLAWQPDNGWIRHLVIGSEGTLVVITAVEVRLAPLPEDRSTLLVTLASLDDVAPVVTALAPLEPAAIELLDRTYLDFVRAAAHGPIPAGTEAVLLVEMENGGRAAEDAVRSLATSTIVAEDPAAIGKLWEIRHLASPMLAALPDGMRSLQVIEDGCVPRERLGEYIAGLRRLAAAHGFDVVIFGHAGDAHVHANVLADVGEPDVVDRLSALLAEASALQVALAGTLAGEHGDGRLRAPFLGDLVGHVFLEACQRVKRAFDPDGILNPGVKVPGAGAPRALLADQLKVGSAAPAIPAEAAQLLRRIERDAAWGAFKLDFAPAPEPSPPDTRHP